MRIRSQDQQGRLGLRSWVASRAALPAGLSQRDCDGPPDPLADANCDDLWNACDHPRQEAIALAFAEWQADDVRDCLLDADAVPGCTPDPSRLEQFGATLWRRWISFRDRALSDLHRRGRLMER